MGTAGHIDHGKTALVKALTGIDCDTHREEKERGITINLGFAHLDLPSGDSVGIIDVPGHRDFVHTMVGGASGIDLALLVVAADSGVMPQTREHLQIMEVLGIRAGLVALTKIDLVEDDIVEMAEEEVRELLKGTFLDGGAAIRVSSTSGEGLDELKYAIGKVVSGLEDRPAGEVFRLFPDRIFTAKGFGTVVTGSVLGGTLKVGQTAYLLPGARELRVRRLERHGREVEQIFAGDRASLNLVGLNREEFERGMVIADRVLPDTKMADVRLRLFDHSRSFGLWTQVVFHVGTYEQQAKVHLIDRDRLTGGGTALAQVHLDEPCIIRYGDRFVVRSTSNDATLGGGEVIDPAPLHHRRRTGDVVEGMSRIVEGTLAELIASEIRKRFRPVSRGEIADILNIPSERIDAVIAEGLPEDIALYSSEEGPVFVIERERESLRTQIQKILGGFHRRNPLNEKGRTAEELMGILGIDRGSSAETTLKMMLDELADEKKIKRVDNTWALFGHSVNIPPDLQRRIGLVEDFLKSNGMQTPLMSELHALAGDNEIDDKELKLILNYLVDARKAYHHDNQYLHAAIVDRCREKLLRALAERGEGVTVAEFRDLVSGNRKICLLMLGIFDNEGVTERVGDLRVLTEKGRTLVEA